MASPTIYRTVFVPESVGLFQASQLMSQNIVHAQTLKADVFIFPGTNPWSEGGL